MITARQLRVTADDAVLLGGIDLEIGVGEKVAILGPNGSGKSTLLRTLAGIQPAATGSVIIDGGELTELAPRDRARRVALMQQRLDVSLGFSVLDTVLMGLHAQMPGLGFAGRDQVAAARGLLASVGVEHLASRSIGAISGGERQRVHFARTLMQGARVTLLDEPTSAQDYAGTRKILAGVSGLLDDGGAVVLVLHDLHLASRWADRIILLSGGVVVADGSPSEVLAEEILESAYGEATEVLRLEDGSIVVRPALAGL